jgi:intergrase/recombinase
MIREYVTNFAVQNGIQLSRVQFVEGRSVGCLDVHLLHLVADQHQVSALVYQSELEALQRGTCVDRLDMKLRAALSRLQLLLNQ